MHCLDFCSHGHNVKTLSLTAFHLLALREALREKILEAKKENGGEDLSYDTLVTLPCLDAVCHKTVNC